MYTCLSCIKIHVVQTGQSQNRTCDIQQGLTERDQCDFMHTRMHTHMYTHSVDIVPQVKTRPP